MQLAIVGSRFCSPEQTSYIIASIDDWISDNGRPARIISGGAAGVDTIAETYAANHGIPFIKFEANWSKHGKAAGPIRNQLIIDAATHVIAFPSRSGKGTQDSIKKAGHKPIPCTIFYID